jgi:hypothetical protein
MREAERVFNDSSYVTPPNVHPYGDPYPEHVPIRHREWCTWSSREWMKPGFRGRIIRDDQEPVNWPMKHDWFRTTEYPEGLWEVSVAQGPLTIQRPKSLHHYTPTPPPPNP